MKKLSFTNSRAKTIESDIVINNYLSTYGHVQAKSLGKPNDFIHSSVIFLYLALLVCQIEYESIDTQNLKKIYQVLGKNFRLDLFDFEDTFLKNLNEKEFSYKVEELGYVIDIAHQLYLAQKDSRDIKFIKSSGYRKMRGAFFTPYPIAKLIVDKSIGQLNLNKISQPSFLDMGCGTGVFCSAISHALIQDGHSSSLILEKLLTGIDIEPLSAIISKIIIQAELHVPLPKILNLDFIRTKDILFDDLDFGLFSTNSITEKFDAVVMNPPYDRLKADRGSASEKALVQRKIKYIKSNPIFKNSATGSIDLYRLFVERGLSLLNPKGVMGAIVPTTFLADKSASGIRKFLIENNALSELIIYPEKAKIFENVTQACSIFIANLNNKKSEIAVSKMKTSSELDSKITVPITTVKSISPSLCPIPLVDKREISLLQKLSAFPKIGEINGILNRRGELDLTLDKQFLTGKDKVLLKGISIDQYDIKEIFEVDFDSFTKSKANSSRIKDVYLARIAGQQISNIDSPIRLKFSLVPPKFIFGNSLNYLVVHEENFSNAFNNLTLLAFLNSRVLNWRFKLTSSNNHVNNYEIDDLPIPINATKRKIQSINKLVANLLEAQLEKDAKNDIIKKVDILILECYNITQKEFPIN